MTFWVTQVSRTAVTNADGRYTFTELRPGIYTIAEAQADGYEDGADTLGTVDGVVRGRNLRNDVFDSVFLPALSEGNDYSFAEFLPGLG